ncbi:MAG: hypothetical protein IJH67_12715 [Thermoguttaceae bacterium]|nr:hypothetical protein [Thermoguttaceae bacterium]
MILDIQYQCVIKTSEQSENDPHAVKARVYPAGDGEIIEALWNIGDLEPDFGVRRSYYIHFESIPSGAKRELEQMKPQPYIKVRNDGNTEYRNNITLKVLTDKQITKEQLQAAMKNAEMLAGYYTDWQADLRQNDVSSKEHTVPFPFKVYLMARDIIGLHKLGATDENKQEKPQTESKSRKQKKHRVTDKDLEKARDLVIKNPELTQEQICAILGVNENCAGFNSDGTKKNLRVVIDNARATVIGGYYLTGEEQDEATDAFFADNSTSKFKHKRRGDDNE